MKTTKTAMAAAVFAMAIAPATVPAMECVSDSVLAWVDNREANAISPARWRAVRETLMGDPGGMSLEDMEVIYNRRVSNGWAAGHWVPIINAVKCLQTVVEEAEEVQPVQAEASLPDTGDVQTRQSSSDVDISQPPADFVYFDDYEEMTSGGERWTKKGRRAHSEWIRPDGKNVVTDTTQAWNKWGPWELLPEDTRLAIHQIPSVPDMLMEQGLEDAPMMASNPVLKGKVTWEGPIDGVISPGSQHLKDPVMVFRYDIGSYFLSKFSAAVRYTSRNTGRAFEYDRWSSVPFKDGKIPDSTSNDGPGYDGLTAQFYGDDNSNFLAGTVRRPRIIGTFVTGTGK